MNDIIRELLDPNIKDEDRQWDGFSFNDLTYSTTDNMYMQTIAFYNFKWNLTVPVMTTWLRGLTAMHYARHFDNFFKFNPTVVEVRQGKVYFGLRGFCMDFSDAQFIGLGVSYGKQVLRQVNKDTRHDRDPEFLDAARGLGEQFVMKYCVGCGFHYGQSIHRVSMHVHTDAVKRNEFKNLAFEWKKAPLVANGGVRSGDRVVAAIESKFPAAKNWTTWWKKRAHLIIEAEMSKHKPEDILASYPTTDNNLEAFHSKFASVVPRKYVPLLLGVSLAYNYIQNMEAHVHAMAEGTRKPSRKRGPQHNRKRLAKDLTADEFVEQPPENARRLKTRR